MPIVETITGSLLDADCPIAHQCNCVTKRAMGLSAQISKKWPWANVYGSLFKDKPRLPGTNRVIKKETVVVICMFGQVNPGKPKKKPEDPDSAESRLTYFKMCLEDIDQNEFEKVAVPYGIGCGLAGGYWPDYEKALNECRTPIVLYKLG
jgi:hypothetical protein